MSELLDSRERELDPFEVLIVIENGGQALGIACRSPDEGGGVGDVDEFATSVDDCVSHPRHCGVGKDGHAR
jgi:hypothetical protein